jgi:hypothetical protein
VHEELIQEGPPALAMVIIGRPPDGQFVLLVLIGHHFSPVSLSQEMHLFVLDFVLGEVGHLDDAVGVLELGGDAVEDVVDLVELGAAEELLLHHVQDGEGDAEYDLGAFKEEEVPDSGNDVEGKVVGEETAEPLETHDAQTEHAVLEVLVQIRNLLFHQLVQGILVHDHSQHVAIVVHGDEGL